MYIQGVFGPTRIDMSKLGEHSFVKELLDCRAKVECSSPHRSAVSSTVLLPEWLWLFPSTTRFMH